MPASAPLPPSNSILHVDMDQFYAAVEIRDRPELRGKPLVIGADPQGGKGRGVVSTASYEARAYGVHSAMPISKAYKLCPQAVFLQGDMGKYAEVSGEIFEIFESFTPEVEGLSLDEAFLDVGASRALFGDALSIAQQVKAKILADTKLVASVGVASNKSVAKIASDLKKPDALVEVKAGEEAAFLRLLPLKRLWGVGPKAEAELNTLGIKSIADLQDFPLALLEGRLGSHAAELQALAFGRDNRAVSSEREAKSLGRESTFDEDTRDSEFLHASLLGLCEALARRLRRHGLRSGQMSLKLRWSGFETHTRQGALDPPSDHGKDLFDATRPYLESFLRKERRAVRLLGVQASKLFARGEASQESLFDAQRGRKERLDQALDRIAERYGDDTVKRAGSE